MLELLTIGIKREINLKIKENSDLRSLFSKGLEWKQLKF